MSSLKDGTITYTATATDSSSNTATSSKTTTKDTAAPVVAITSVTNPITAANASNTTASGTGEAGDTISLVATDGTHTTSPLTTTVTTGGTWSINNVNVSTLNDGPVTYTATVTSPSGNTAQGSDTAIKSALATASLSGFVYNDSNGNSTKTARNLDSRASISFLTAPTPRNALPSQTAPERQRWIVRLHGPFGLDYTITEIQPSLFQDGSATAGSLGGTPGTDAISNITVATGASGANYNFGEHGLVQPQISSRMLLASSPPAQQIFDNAVTSSAIPPIVVSMTKASPDPTTASTVNYTVTFSQAVTGVTAAEFQPVTSTNVSAHRSPASPAAAAPIRSPSTPAPAPAPSG